MRVQYGCTRLSSTSVLIRNALSTFVVPIDIDTGTSSPRVTAIRCFNIDCQDIVICSAYMPWNNSSDNHNHLIEFISVLGCLQSVIDRHVGCLFVFGGDFNVENYSSNGFHDALQHFCNGNSLCWVEPVTGSISYTYHCDIH